MNTHSVSSEPISASTGAVGSHFSRPTDEEIARRAYEIYVSHGRMPGKCLHNWLQAERELRKQYAPRPAQRTTHQDNHAALHQSYEEPQELGSSSLHLSYALAGTGGMD